LAASYIVGLEEESEKRSGTQIEDPKHTVVVKLASEGLLDFGCGILEIALTVAGVEWLLERRRKRDEIEQVSTRALMDIDHAMWVWQGGRREFDLVELRAAINAT
jgi:hypothetical protein